MSWVDTPNSSNISRYKYDERTHVLTVEFKNGGTYNYFDVPHREFAGMNASDSKGQYLAHQIKGVYRYARI